MAIDIKKRLQIEILPQVQTPGFHVDNYKQQRTSGGKNALTTSQADGDQVLLDTQRPGGPLANRANEV